MNALTSFTFSPLPIAFTLHWEEEKIDKHFQSWNEQQVEVYKKGPFKV